MVCIILDITDECKINFILHYLSTKYIQYTQTHLRKVSHHIALYDLAFNLFFNPFSIEDLLGELQKKSSFQFFLAFPITIG